METQKCTTNINLEKNQLTTKAKNQSNLLVAVAVIFLFINEQYRKTNKKEKDKKNKIKINGKRN